MHEISRGCMLFGTSATIFVQFCQYRIYFLAEPTKGLLPQEQNQEPLFPTGEWLLVALQMVKHVWCVLRQFPQSATSVQLRAVATSIVAFLHYAQAYFTQFAAIECLAPLRTASHTVYPFGLEFHLVHLSPFLSHFLTQTVIVVQGGNTCLTFLAVEAATSNQLFHDFYFYLSLNPQHYKIKIILST